MRIRTIKPKFWRSNDITALPMDIRLLFVGLWAYVDDNGVGVDDYRQIAADLFALEDDPTAIRAFVREGLATLSRQLLIVRYEVEQTPLIFVTTWDLHQKVDRPNKARYPRPPGGFDPSTSGNHDGPQILATSSRDPREGPSTVVRKRGREEEDKNTSARGARGLDRFEEFYRAYPRHIDRKAAEAAWTRAIKDHTPDQIIEAARRYAQTCRGKEAKYVKYPATWLNKGGYLDEPDPPELKLVVGDDGLRRDPKTGRVIESWG